MTSVHLLLKAKVFDGLARSAHFIPISRIVNLLSALLRGRAGDVSGCDVGMALKDGGVGRAIEEGVEAVSFERKRDRYSKCCGLE